MHPSAAGLGKLHMLAVNPNSLSLFGGWISNPEAFTMRYFHSVPRHTDPLGIHIGQFSQTLVPWVSPRELS